MDLPPSLPGENEAKPLPSEEEKHHTAKKPGPGGKVRNTDGKAHDIQKSPEKRLPSDITNIFKQQNP